MKTTKSEPLEKWWIFIGEYKKMANWRNRPRNISHIEGGIPWIIAIDESGSPDLSYAQRYISPFATNYDEHNVHFNVTACLLSTSDFNETRDMVMELKHKYWTDAKANYKNELRRVCFHSTEIRRRKNAFDFSDKDTHRLFVNDLSDVLGNINIKLFSSHINKLSLVRQYTTPYDPYELSLTFILERIALEINKQDAVIILESRGKKEDRKLLNHIKKLLDYGTPYISKDRFSFIKGVYFNGKWDEESNKLKSHWILELADLYCYPIFKYGKDGTKDPAFNVLEKKLSGHPEYYGVGIKKFP